MPTATINHDERLGREHGKGWDAKMAKAAWEMPSPRGTFVEIWAEGKGKTVQKTKKYFFYVKNFIPLYDFSDMA